MSNKMIAYDDDGGEYLVTLTPQIYEDFRQFDCEHLKTALCIYTVRHGHTQIRAQCQKCGELVGHAIKRLKEHDALPVKNENLVVSYKKILDAKKNEILLKHFNEQQSYQSEYEKYLAGPIWAELRKKVLNRDGNICQSCLEKPATQVHHLTYEDIFHEHAWQLKSICAACHNRVHHK